MTRKTQWDRDLIDYPIAIRAAKTRTRKIELIREFEAKHGRIPDRLLGALGSSEFARGLEEEARFAMGEENE